MPWNLYQYFTLSNFVKMHYRQEKQDVWLTSYMFFVLTLLEVRFRSKLDSAEIFKFFPHREKLKKNEICQNFAAGK